MVLIKQIVVKGNFCHLAVGNVIVWRGPSRSRTVVPVVALALLQTTFYIVEFYFRESIVWYLVIIV